MSSLKKAFVAHRDVCVRCGCAFVCMDAMEESSGERCVNEILPKRYFERSRFFPEFSIVLTIKGGRRRELLAGVYMCVSQACELFIHLFFDHFFSHFKWGRTFVTDMRIFIVAIDQNILDSLNVRPIRAKTDM